MFNLSVPDFLLTMATAVLILGLVSLCIGIFVLVSKTVGNDVKAIATQTAKMAQKGIAEDVSGSGRECIHTIICAGWPDPHKCRDWCIPHFYRHSY